VQRQVKVKSKRTGAKVTFKTLVSAVPQELVDWLSPALQVSSFLAHNPRGPDLVVIGFQESLPLHLDCRHLNDG
jgi:hypothetical protein